MNIGTTTESEAKAADFLSRGTARGSRFASAIYGICVVCHEKTALENLVARPATSLCHTCAKSDAA